MRILRHVVGGANLLFQHFVVSLTCLDVFSTDSIAVSCLAIFEAADGSLHLKS